MIMTADLELILPTLDLGPVADKMRFLPLRLICLNHASYSASTIKLYPPRKRTVKS